MFDEYMSKEDEDGADKPQANETSSIGFDSLLAAMKRDSNEEPAGGGSMWTEMSKKLSRTSTPNGKNSQPRSLLVNDAKPVQNRCQPYKTQNTLILHEK